MKRDMVCIACPVGCRLNVTWHEDGPLPEVHGNKCEKGGEYGREEVLSPRRVVTATVKFQSLCLGRLPVKTNKPLLKGLIPGLLNELYAIELRPPVKIGDKVIGNFSNSGVDVVVTRSVHD